MTEEVEMIDLNQADVEILTALPGIGSVLAKRIVEYRETVHPFEEVIELAAVPGISERIVRDFENRVMVTTPAVVESVARTVEASVVETAQLEPESVAEDTSEATAGEESEQERELETQSMNADETEIALPVLTDDDRLDIQEAAVELDQFAELDSAPPPPQVVERGLQGASEERPVIAAVVDSPAAPARDQEKRARQRGCFALVAGAVLGAVVGTILSLSVLAQLNNGTLRFYQADTQLRSELSNARQEQGDLDEQLGLLGSQVNDLATRTVMMAQQQETADKSLAELQQTITSIEREVNALESVTEQLDKRLVGVAAAAESFNTFLNSLRDLLFELQGPPPTRRPEATPTSTAAPAETMAPGTSEIEAPEATPTSLGQPTRTPRPTATTFPSLTTSTPEPQP